MPKFLSRLKEEAEGTLGLLWKKIDPKNLNRGDHIYCHKRCGSYSHHGIFVGEDRVIHFTRTEPKKAKVPLPKSQQSSDRPRRPCPYCRYDEEEHRGVVRTCLQCFRRGEKKLHSIRRYVYGVPRLVHRLKKSGTCTMLVCNRSPEQVVRVAEELLRSNDFGVYDLQQRNCEHFATYCKTGVRQCEQMSFYNKAGKWVKKVFGIRTTKSNVPRYRK